MMKPTKVNGKWKKPIISKRNCAEIRKSSILNGTFGTWETGKGGWLEEWDGTKRHIVMKPLKLTADERNMDARFERVQTGLRNQAKKVEEMKQVRKAAKPLTGLDKWLAEIK